MDTDRLKTVLRALADEPGDVVVSKGEVAASIHGEVLTGTLSQKGGELQITADGATESATAWISRSVARLPQLADRILSAAEIPLNYVAPEGDLLSPTEPGDRVVPVKDAQAATIATLGQRTPGTCTVLYVTSDAGEGKTTLINTLAVAQAHLYRTRRTDWLLVPIALGGRPFMNLDDVIVATMVNQLRFPRLYFDAFLELVRLGLVVPALDGFEEIFTETPDGEAVSNLGSLITRLKGEGTLLVAARQAYFEYRSLDTQARLLDSLPDSDVAFGPMALHKWSRATFVEYAKKSQVTHPDDLYDTIAARVGASHPVLTRAVLVRRVIDLAKELPDYPTIAGLIGPTSSQFDSAFISSILKREATEKWLDKDGTPPRPLLSVEQHHALLGLIAEECWTAKQQVVSEDVLDSLAELFCESQGLRPAASRQIKERLRHHALLARVAHGSRAGYRFDHEHFREFFLGEQLGIHLINQSMADLRKVLRVDLLPSWALDAAVATVPQDDDARAKLIAKLCALANAESPSSFVRENLGGICIRLADGYSGAALELHDLLMPVNALAGRRLAATKCVRCYFRATSLRGTSTNGVAFSECVFERLDITRTCKSTATQLEPSSAVHCAVDIDTADSAVVYDPIRIDEMLTGLGWRMKTAQTVSRQTEFDDRYLVAEKAIRTFARCTQVSEGTFHLRLSVHWALFSKRVLPDLLAANVLRKVKHRGSGIVDRFGLGRPLSQVAKALADSARSYEEFLRLMHAQ